MYTPFLSIFHNFINFIARRDATSLWALNSWHSKKKEQLSTFGIPSHELNRLESAYALLVHTITRIAEVVSGRLNPECWLDTRSNRTLASLRNILNKAKATDKINKSIICIWNYCDQLMSMSLSCREIQRVYRGHRGRVLARKKKILKGYLQYINRNVLREKFYAQLEAERKAWIADVIKWYDKKREDNAVG